MPPLSLGSLGSTPLSVAKAASVPPPGRARGSRLCTGPGPRRAGSRADVGSGASPNRSCPPTEALGAHSPLIQFPASGGGGTAVTHAMGLQASHLCWPESLGSCPDHRAGPAGACVWGQSTFQFQRRGLSAGARPVRGRVSSLGPLRGRKRTGGRGTQSLLARAALCPLPGMTRQVPLYDPADVRASCHAVSSRQSLL